LQPLVKAGRYDYDQLCQDFRWSIPKHFNIGVASAAAADRTPDSIALYYENERGEEQSFTFGQLQRDAYRLANVLVAKGIKPGDRVGIVLPQRYEAGVAHIAISIIGAIALPLSVMFGEDALSYRLQDSGASAILVDKNHRELLQSMQSQLPELHTIIDCDDSNAEQGLWPLLEKARDQFDPLQTLADDPAFLIYTSGTTGPPKGALGAHRCLIGNLTGFELSQNFFPQTHDVFWTPADWAWTGGLLDALLPSWCYGIPVLGYESRGFDPERVCHLLQKYRVTNGFIPPTALKMLRQVPNIERFDFAFRSIMSAGETLGAEIYHWSEETFGLQVNEMCGQTEFNYIVGNCSAIYPVKPGSMGKAYPGHRVEPVSAEGEIMPIGETGELAAHRDDPVMFLGYWNREEATRGKFRGEYWGLGDLCYRDDEGYLWFLGRDDDIISSAGYRIGPGEVEDSLIKHPSVAQCAVIGVPDELRGQIVKAYVVLTSDAEASDALAAEIQQSVKSQLAAHEYPRQIAFIDELPMTTTGKVRRVALREMHEAETGGS
jgi:acetyl-CoA synthetase